jgi:dipeptidyl aminopeptidase/acylaminoacyl peptidase
MKAIRFIIAFCVIAGLPANAQEGNLKVTPDDFEKWGTLSGEGLSPNGKWAAFRMEYTSGKDTLFLQNLDKGKQNYFPNGHLIAFSPDSKRIAVRLQGNTISLIDLASKNAVAYSGVTRFDFLPDGKYLVLYQSTGHNILSLFDRQHKLLTERDNVSDYTVSRQGKVAIIEPGAVSLLDVTDLKVSKITTDTLSAYSRIHWSKSGRSLVFFSKAKKDGNISIVHYYCANQQSRLLESTKIIFQGQLHAIEPYKLAVSDDEMHVYFLANEISTAEATETLVEIWDSETFYEYPMIEQLKQPGMNAALSLWDVVSSKLHKLDGDDFQNVKILPGGRYALAESRSSMVSRTAELAPADYYSIDLKTMRSQLMVKQCSRSAGLIKADPSGQFVSYFKDGNYHIFDNQSGKTTNITAAIPIDFRDAEFDDSGANPGYYSPGWTSDGRSVILYDQYDVWLFSPDGRIAKKITDGRKDKTRFRVVVDRSQTERGTVASNAWEKNDIQKGIILSARGADMASGYYYYDDKKGLVKLLYGSFKASRIIKATEANEYLYVEETSARPPSLNILSSNKKPRRIFQSNRHSVKYDWGRSELIAYTNSHGDSLKGVLIYPAGYVKGKKYPMVVYIYERLSSTLHDYNNPVLADRAGFSAPAYFLDGYLVLMPDIKYELNAPGPSALDCVTSAVNAVINRNVVQENHIGLIGHSFGGTETAFIVTQTKMFAAAVSSGAVTDPVSYYLTLNPFTNRSNNWRFESHQFRMKTSPLHDWDSFIRNSAIAHAANITTPLLSWSGKSDGSVNYEQGIELHLALRRLNKRNIFLLYPNQGHILSDEKAKRDVTKRVKDWFDLYLKE